MKKYIYLLIAVVIALISFILGPIPYITFLLMTAQFIALLLYLREMYKETPVVVRKDRQPEPTKLSDMTPEQRKRFVEDNFR